jgi:hypothetical protein
LRCKCRRRTVTRRQESHTIDLNLSAILFGAIIRKRRPKANYICLLCPLCHHFLGGSVQDYYGEACQHKTQVFWNEPRSNFQAVINVIGFGRPIGCTSNIYNHQNFTESARTSLGSPVHANSFVGLDSPIEESDCSIPERSLYNHDIHLLSIL